VRAAKSRTEQSRKLIDQLEGEPAFGPLIAVLATTFDLTPDFVELDFLPSLVRVPAWDDRKIRARVQLEAELGRLDAVCLLQEASRFQGRPRSLRVHVTPASPASGGVLHAKVTLLVYAEAVRLVVGSANLTPLGYRENREVTVTLTASAKRQGEATLVLAAVERMPTVLGAWWSPSAELVVSRARDLLKTWAAPGDRPADERFAWSGGAATLWPQFLEMWPQGEPIERIRIVSPFWSDAIDSGPVPILLSELRARGARLDGARLELLTGAAMDAGEKGIPVLPASYAAFDFGAFGVEAFALAVKTRVDAEDVDRDDVLRERTLHAKVVLVDGPKTRLAYAGSANFTAPGWGFTLRASNIEAGMLIRRSRKDLQL
jgi:phosphatidylserine/phosphatidylglycerophosphate/cardiolipin synthase-like enzyme